MSTSTSSIDLIIVPLNLEAAFAQEFVLRRAKGNGYEDAFLNYIPMESPGEAVILSDTYVYWRRPKALWVGEATSATYLPYLSKLPKLLKLSPKLLTRPTLPPYPII